MGITRAAAFASLSLLIATLPAFAEGVGKVVQSSGTVRGVLRGGSSWAPVGMSQAVSEGDLVKTEKHSMAALMLDAGAQIALGPESLVKLDGADALRLLTGRVRVVAPSSTSVAISAGGDTLRAKDAEVILARSNGKWQVAVVSGTCSVSDGTGKRPFELGAGRIVSFENSDFRMAPLGRVALEHLEQPFLLGAEPSAAETAAPAANPAVASALGGNRWVSVGLSALLPGTGQIYQGDWTRGLAYLGADFALLGASFYARSVGQPQWANGLAYGVLGVNLLSPLDAYWHAPAAPAAPVPNP